MSGSTKFMIIAVLLAVLIIGGAVMLAKRSQQPPAPQGIELADKTQLVLQSFYQDCAEGDQCIVIDSHCGFCCDYVAINARYEADFNRAFDKSCNRYRGEMCQCYDLSSYPSCVDGKCTLVNWPEE